MAEIILFDVVPWFEECVRQLVVAQVGPTVRWILSTPSQVKKFTLLKGLSTFRFQESGREEKPNHRSSTAEILNYVVVITTMDPEPFKNLPKVQRLGHVIIASCFDDGCGLRTILLAVHFKIGFMPRRLERYQKLLSEKCTRIQNSTCSLTFGLLSFNKRKIVFLRIRLRPWKGFKILVDECTKRLFSFN